MNEYSADELPSVFEDGELYDVLLSDFPYGLDFYLGLAREAYGPVLDVACGTGRILLRCLESGVDVEGLDLYQPMLERLRAKAAGLNLRPVLHQADMSDFALPRRYGLVMIPFNAFIHNMSQETQLACLRCCHEHLLPGGLLAFDTFFPSLEIISSPAGTRVLEGEFVHPKTGQQMRLYDIRTFDRVQQTQQSVNEIEVLNEDGSVRSVQRSQVGSRYIFKQEMALLLRVTGFARWEICGDFDRRPLTRESDAMIVMAWKEE